MQLLERRTAQIRLASPACPWLSFRSASLQCEALPTCATLPRPVGLRAPSIEAHAACSHQRGSRECKLTGLTSGKCHLPLRLLATAAHDDSHRRGAAPHLSSFSPLSLTTGGRCKTTFCRTSARRKISAFRPTTRHLLQCCTARRPAARRCVTHIGKCVRAIHTTWVVRAHPDHCGGQRIVPGTATARYLHRIA